jgi:hypothetical protein
MVVDAFLANWSLLARPVSAFPGISYFISEFAQYQPSTNLGAAITHCFAKVLYAKREFPGIRNSERSGKIVAAPQKPIAGSDVDARP